MVPREFSAGGAAEPALLLLESEDDDEAPDDDHELSETTVLILEAAAKFLFTDDLQASLAAFSANHASMFAGAAGTEGEQRLEWSEAHRDFQQVRKRSSPPHFK